MECKAPTRATTRVLTQPHNRSRPYNDYDPTPRGDSYHSRGGGGLGWGVETLVVALVGVHICKPSTSPAARPGWGSDTLALAKMCQGERVQSRASSKGSTELAYVDPARATTRVPSPPHNLPRPYYDYDPTTSRSRIHLCGWQIGALPFSSCKLVGIVADIEAGLFQFVVVADDAIIVVAQPERADAIHVRSFTVTKPDHRCD